ncbi:23S rRNA (uracil(1939)-C(5))-methyltransferase RlmD [bacterium]|nr:23S rRNA (uracil(1939)-C(5))-methyltransferase RlmD [bacterium]
MQINDIYEVQIKKMLYEGKALARVNAFPVFIDGGCPNDILKVVIKKINKNYALADIVEIVKPSESRVEPLCALHNVCGSCGWQHIDYNEQLRQKQNIVFETIKKITGFEYKIHDIIPSPKQYQYRCKVQLPVEQTKVSKRLITGYYKKNSHELVNIKFCPLQADIISEIAEFIKLKAQKIGISGYDERQNKGLLRHIIFRHNSELSQILVIFVLNAKEYDGKIDVLANNIMKNYPLVVGVCANYNTAKSNVILGKETKVIIGNNYYIECLSDKHYKVSANSFFQVNPYCAVMIFNKVKELITSKIKNPSVLDAYSGVSSFGIWLSDIAKSVVCVEEVEASSNDAIYNTKLNNIDNLEILNGDAAKRFDDLIKSGAKFDVSLIDPPRKGCSVEAIENLVKLTDKYIVYVSCNVTTLARDMNLLKEKGFIPIYIQPADMFPQTYHIETIVLFEKVN